MFRGAAGFVEMTGSGQSDSVGTVAACFRERERQRPGCHTCGIKLRGFKLRHPSLRHTTSLDWSQGTSPPYNDHPFPQAFLQLFSLSIEITITHHSNPSCSRRRVDQTYTVPYTVSSDSSETCVGCRDQRPLFNVRPGRKGVQMAKLGSFVCLTRLRSSSRFSPCLRRAPLHLPQYGY